MFLRAHKCVLCPNLFEYVPKVPHRLRTSLFWRLAPSLMETCKTKPKMTRTRQLIALKGLLTVGTFVISSFDLCCWMPIGRIWKETSVDHISWWLLIKHLYFHCVIVLSSFQNEGKLKSSVQKITNTSILERRWNKVEQLGTSWNKRKMSHLHQKVPWKGALEKSSLQSMGLW